MGAAPRRGVPRVRVAIGAAVILVAAPLVLVLVFSAGAVLGLPFTYESAPDGPAPPGLLKQLTLMHWTAAPVMLAVSLACGWLAGARTPRAGAVVGAIWAGAYLLVQAVLALGQRVTSSLVVSGTWAVIAAIALGPVAAGALRARRGGRG